MYLVKRLGQGFHVSGFILSENLERERLNMNLELKIEGQTTSDEYGRGADSVRAEDTCMSDAEQGGHHDN